jgi:cell division septation protein DedD
MEQKRILWIVAAVGVFLLVVIGAALILYSPARQTEPELASAALQDTTWIRAPLNPQNEQSSGQTASTVSAQTGDTTLTVTSQPTQPAAPQSAQQNTLASGEKTGDVTVYTENARVYSSGVTTIDLNSLKGQNGQDVAASNVQPVSASVEAITKPATAAVAPVAAVSTKAPAVKPAPKPVATPAVIKSPAPLPDQFWVQAASYASKKNADNAREALAVNKIPCEVFTYTDSKSKVYYRVRVGPYASKSEAEYWQSRIALIEEFANTQSYVTNATAKAN